MWTIVAWFFVLYYNVIFSCKETVKDFDYVVCIKVVCLFNSIEARYLGNAFIFDLAIAIVLFIGSLRIFRKWWVGIDGSGLHITIHIFHKVRCAHSWHHYLFLLAGYRYRARIPPIRYQSRCHLSEISYAGIYNREMVPWGQAFPRSEKGRTGIGF